MTPTPLPWSRATRTTALALLLASGLFLFEGPVAGLILGFALTRIALLLGGRLSTAREVAAFAALAGVIGWISSIAADRILLSAFVLSAAVLGSILASGYRGELAPLAGVLTVWTVVALSLGDLSQAVIEIFGLVGGALLAAVLGLFEDPRSTTTDVNGESTQSVLGLGLSLAALVFAAVLLGFWAFSDFPYWIAITVIVVLAVRPDMIRRRIAERFLGTLAGVLFSLGWVVIGPDSEVWLLLGMLATVYLQFLFMDRNYVLFAMFLTAVITLGSAAAGIEVTDSALARLGATFLGGALAALLLAIPPLSPTPKEP